MRLTNVAMSTLRAILVVVPFAARNLTHDSGCGAVNDFPFLDRDEYQVLSK